MPIYQLIYWAQKASEDAKQQARDADIARKAMARNANKFKR